MNEFEDEFRDLTLDNDEQFNETSHSGTRKKPKKPVTEKQASNPKPKKQSAQEQIDSILSSYIPKQPLLKRQPAISIEQQQFPEHDYEDSEDSGSDEELIITTKKKKPKSFPKRTHKQIVGSGSDNRLDAIENMMKELI